MFLQAAGMAHHKVRTITESGDFESLVGPQRILARLAWKASRAPLKLDYADTLEARRALSNEGAFLEAAMVIAGFNFANRCADALGVRTEVPGFFERWPRFQWM